MTSDFPLANGRPSTVLYGRGTMLDDFSREVERGRTLFALEGVSGVGKSALLRAVVERLEGTGFSSVGPLNAAQLPSEELAIAAIYVRLQQLDVDAGTGDAALGERATADLPQALKTLFGAAAADIAKLVTDKAENTIDALRGIITGKDASPGIGTHLNTLDRENLRYFLGLYLKAFADGSRPLVIAIDNFDSADAGIVSLIRFLIKAKPSGLVLVIAHNSEVGDNTSWDYVVADVRAERGHAFTAGPLDRPAVQDWFHAEVGRWPTTTELDALEAATFGRAYGLQLAIAAIREGADEPLQGDYTGYYDRARRALTNDARTVAELLAIIGRDAMVDRDLLAAAAHDLRTDSIGAAIDALRDRRQLKEDEHYVALAHSLAQQSWRDTLNTPRKKRLAEAWFAAIRSFDLEELTGPGARGLIPVVVAPLLEFKLVAEVAEIGARLISIGQIGIGLELIDRTWDFKAVEATGGADMLQHAMLAARTRLDLGHYRDVDEPLRMAELAAGDDTSAKIEILLLRMKLALRRNTYAALWALADQLESGAVPDSTTQIEAEQILNAAYRDLLDIGGLRGSTDRLLALRSAATADEENSIDRALARSFAKLGETDVALEHATAAVASSGSLGSIRIVGNANLALAEVLRYRHDFEAAIAAYRDAASIARASGNRDSQLWSLMGEAAAHIEGGAPEKASSPLAEVDALLLEPGYEHPLETAHASLLHALAGVADSSTDEIAQRYEPFQMTWPAEHLREFRNSGKLPGPTPL